MARVKKIDYSFWIGIGKSLKANIIVFAPAILAFLVSVPVEYTPIASFLVYLLKNWYEVTTGKKI